VPLKGLLQWNFRNTRFLRASLAWSRTSSRSHPFPCCAALRRCRRHLRRPRRPVRRAGGGTAGASAGPASAAAAAVGPAAARLPATLPPQPSILHSAEAPFSRAAHCDCRCAAAWRAPRAQKRLHEGRSHISWACRLTPPVRARHRRPPSTPPFYFRGCAAPPASSRAVRDGCTSCASVGVACGGRARLPGLAPLLPVRSPSSPSDDAGGVSLPPSLVPVQHGRAGSLSRNGRWRHL
jgi:hypothetical protein